MLGDKIAELKLAGKSHKEVALLLNCSESTVTYWVRKKGLPRSKKPKHQNTFERDVLEAAISRVKCWSDLCTVLGKKRTASLHIALRDQAEDYSIDVSHFIYADPRKSPAVGRTKGGRTLEQMLQSKTTKSDDLRKKLISDGLKSHECEKCKLTDWMGSPITLELDHIDGDHFNNALTNLQILCPNCHSQTPHHRVPFRLRKAIKQQ